MTHSTHSATGIVKFLFIACFLFINVLAFGQDTLKAGKPVDLGKPTDFGYKHKWQYFKLEDTLVAKVIQHLPAPAYCGILATASITIVETQKGDIIRILDMCNVSNQYKAAQKIKIVPASKPSFGLATAVTLKENPKTKKLEPSDFDLSVLKTTWGSLLVN